MTTIQKTSEKIEAIISNNNTENLFVKIYKNLPKSAKIGIDHVTQECVSYYIYKKSDKGYILYNLLLIIEVKLIKDKISFVCSSYGQLVRYEIRKNRFIKSFIKYVKDDQDYDESLFSYIDENIKFCIEYVNQLKAKKN